MKFKVGDVCIGTGFLRHTVRNGMECELLEFNPDKIVIFAGTDRHERGPHWFLRWADCAVSWQHESQLRLKRPPSWDRWIFDTSDVDNKQESPLEIGETRE